jgi:hypothetical protein
MRLSRFLVGLPVEAYSAPRCGYLMGCTALEPALLKLSTKPRFENQADQASYSGD